MINSERTLNLTQKAVDAPGQALPDWQIIARVACEMGFTDAFSYASAEEVFEEIKQAWNPATGYDIRGASYARLRNQPVQWPCAPADEHTRNPIRYLSDIHARPVEAAKRPAILFPTANGKAVFFPRPHMPPAELPSDAFPMVLNTGRLQHQWHTLTKTGKVPTLNALNALPFVELHPDDALALGIRDGDGVEIRSARGLAVLPAAISDRVLPGNCFAPFHWNDVYGDNLAINAVTNDAVDPISRQPEFKCCAVALRKVELIGHRFLDLPQADTETHTAPEQAPLLTVLWASQTGNAEALARQIGDHLKTAGVAVQVAAMDSFASERLDHLQNVALISSTFGDGESPDNGQRFWQSLAARQERLESLRYAVLALGDSSYDRFCQHGKNLDQRLQELGASSLIARVECDGEYQAHADHWFTGLQQALSLNLPTPSIVDNAPVFGNQPSRTQPHHARVSLNRRLNTDGAAKDTRQLALTLEGSGMTYEAGDALGVWPRNCPELVDELLELTGLNAEQPVRGVKAADVPLRQALAEQFEIARPSADTLAFIAERNGSHDLQTLLTEPFKSELKDWLWGRQVADVLREFPIACSAQEWLDHLKPLQPRLYSIASSAKAHPDEVHLTVSAVRYGARKGVSSTFLADRAGECEVPIFLQPTKHFRPPADGDVPMIMIGPGTGVAPFRAFLQERRARGDRGRNWLFFGEQHQASDFYYREELQGMQQDGLLTRLSLAFSRDQAQKIYVQQRIQEQGAELWRWLEEGAHLYVCGDASRMARDVDQALRRVISEQGGVSLEKAAERLRCLTEQKRYVRDVY